jgi:DNA primase
MTTKTIDTSSVKQSIDLRELAARYVELRRASGEKELCGPCPKCGGDNRFYVQSDFFACRHCHLKRGDAIEFFMWLNGVDFKNAVALLTNAPMPTTAPTKRTPAAPKAKEWDEPKRRAEVLANHSALVDGKVSQAQACITYLESRGINKTAINVFKLGVRSINLPNTWSDEKQDYSYSLQRALVLPWFNHDGALMCIKYRFLESHTYTNAEGKEQTENKTSRGSPIGQAFG